MVEAPDALVRRRLALAARVARQLQAEEPVATALVVGSTALRRCSERADLDLVLVSRDPPAPDRFSSRTVRGVRVEIERMSRTEALAATTGTGWVWELRAAARLGGGIAVHDPLAFAACLARRAAAMRPDAARAEESLRGVYLALADLGRGGGDPRGRADLLRGCLDNLALLALLHHPRRYQKAKWALADLLHAGEAALVGALLVAYGVVEDDPASARRALDGAHALVADVYACAGLPGHDEVLARGYAPDLAEASYVSRCLDDAADLAATGRWIEAQYVAKFAARLAAGLVGAADAAAQRYLDLFCIRPDPVTPEALEAALAAADACRRWLGAATRQPQPV